MPRSGAAGPASLLTAQWRCTAPPQTPTQALFKRRDYTSAHLTGVPLRGTALPWMRRQPRSSTRRRRPPPRSRCHAGPPQEPTSSCHDARLVRRDEILDVDEGVLAPALLQQLERVADQLPEAFVVLLPVVDAVAQVLVPGDDEVDCVSRTTHVDCKLRSPAAPASSPVDVDVEHRQQLAVVGHQGLPHQVAAHNKLLQQLQRDAHHGGIARV